MVTGRGDASGRDGGHAERPFLRLPRPHSFALASGRGDGRKGSGKGKENAPSHRPYAPPKYYPSVVTGGRLTLRDLADQIAEISTVSSLDTLAVLEGLLKIIPREIARGNIVELGSVGSFRVRIKSEGSDTAEEVNTTNIVNILPRFVPGKLFKKALNDAEFRKAIS